MSEDWFWKESFFARVWVWVYSIGHVVFYFWIGLGIWGASEALAFEFESEAKKYFVFIASILLTCVGCWYLVAAWKVIFNQLIRQFVVYGIGITKNLVDVRGYYFKRARFQVSDVENVEEMESKKGETRQYDSILSPGRENYRLLMKDGRIFYFRDCGGLSERLKHGSRS